MQYPKRMQLLHWNALVVFVTSLSHPQIQSSSIRPRSNAKGIHYFLYLLLFRGRVIQLSLRNAVPAYRLKSFLTPFYILSKGI